MIWIAVLVAICGFALVPETIVDEVTGESERVWPLKLGLDLQGGMHLAVEIYDPENALSGQDLDDAVERTLTTIRNRIDEFGVREPTIQRSGNRIIIELAGVDDPEQAKRIATETAFMEFKIVTDGQDFMDALERIDRAIVNEVGIENLQVTTLETEPEVDLSDILGGAADSAGAEDPPNEEGAAEGGDPAEEGDPAADSLATEEEMADAVDEATARPLSALLGQGRILGEYLVPQEDQPTAAAWLELEAVREAIPRGVTLHWGVEQVGAGAGSYVPLYVLEAEPLITGDMLQDAGPANRDPTFNQPIVPFETTRRGSRVFERGTARNIGENMAIVLDDRVQSYAVIRSVLSRRAQIELTPGASFQEAQELALVLRAGALPMPIEVVEERNVSASLGEDSIRQGRTAFIIGIVGVIIVMMIYYRAAGILAVGALLTYVIFMLGGLAGLDATLTLPGIAGLILSIGMAVDANVLIFERVREELAAGKTPRTAVDAGFGNALSAIVDANLTTLITGIILFQFGTGAVRGFAVTLCIGILASFFSAIYVTRTLFIMYLNRRGSRESVSI
ncbi:protein translocase subunit SecD [Candidatus Palauibacter soopunensis]|uniref:protein translocase subunit SecD n=1 Tax=Candidatus Palauibacter soopunensis TaxID=3056739 RepID=UPI00238B5A6B|nr:protein translocase subunit SecD [Candidatus Palauibacter soopunensis]MDE2880012.1 protein translocase subunit SecD [Candidatus Palauibacter soopunensis]